MPRRQINYGRPVLDEFTVVTMENGTLKIQTDDDIMEQMLQDEDIDTQIAHDGLSDNLADMYDYPEDKKKAKQVPHRTQDEELNSELITYNRMNPHTKLIVDSKTDNDTRLSYFNFEENFPEFTNPKKYITNAFTNNFHRLFLKVVGLTEGLDTKDFSVSDFKKGIKNFLAHGHQEPIFDTKTFSREAPDFSTSSWLKDQAKKTEKYNDKLEMERYRSAREKNPNLTWDEYNGGLIATNPYVNQNAKKISITYKDDYTIGSKEYLIQEGRTMIAGVLRYLTGNGDAHSACYGLLNKNSLKNKTAEFDLKKLEDFVNCMSDDEIYEAYLDGWTPERMNNYVDEVIKGLPDIGDRQLFRHPNAVDPKSMAIENAVDAFVKLNTIHAQRSGWWKFFNPLRNYRENDAIDRLKTSLLNIGIKETTLNNILADQANSISAHSNSIQGEHYDDFVRDLQEKKDFETAVGKLPKVNENDDLLEPNEIDLNCIRDALKTYAEIDIEYNKYSYFHRATHSARFHGLNQIKEELETRLNALGVDSETIQNYVQQAKQNVLDGNPISLSQNENVRKAQGALFEKQHKQINPGKDVPDFNHFLLDHVYKEDETFMSKVVKEEPVHINVNEANSLEEQQDEIAIEGQNKELVQQEIVQEENALEENVPHQ